MNTLKDKILIIVTVISLALAGFFFIKNRQLSSAAEAGKRTQEVEKKIAYAKERIRIAGDIAVLFNFSLNENIEEEALEAAKEYLSVLGSDAILKEWDELQSEKARESVIYSLRVRNLFLALLKEADDFLGE